MYRAPVKMKKTLQSKWNNWVNTLHMERLTNVKPRVNTKRLIRFERPTVNNKKEQMLEGNFIK